MEIFHQSFQYATTNLIAFIILLQSPFVCTSVFLFDETLSKL